MCASAGRGAVQEYQSCPHEKIRWSHPLLCTVACLILFPCRGSAWYNWYSWLGCKIPVSFPLQYRVQPNITVTIDWGVKYQFSFLCSAGTCVPMRSWCLRRLTCRGYGSGFPVSFTHSDMALWSLSQCSQSLCSPSAVLLQSHTVPLQSFTVPLQSHTVLLQPLPSACWTSGLWVLMFHWQYWP